MGGSRDLRKKLAGFMIDLTARCDQPSKVVVTGSSRYWRGLCQRTWCAWRRTRCGIFAENVVFQGGLTFRAIKMSAAASSYYMAVRVVDLALMTVLRCF